MKIIDPVIVRPLMAEWETLKAEITAVLSGAKSKAAKVRALSQTEARLDTFLARLAALRVLDPACGSGNFLYLALQTLKDIEYRAIVEAETLGLARRVVHCGPENVKGIEVNGYAAELARTTIWIGDIQWKRRNGFEAKDEPVLRSLDAIECRDALITKVGVDGPALYPSSPDKPGSDDGAERYVEAEWPAAEFIVGNPPFLGNKRMIDGLGERYVTALRALYSDRVSGGVDLVTYWFVKAWQSVTAGSASRVGLVATNSIRSGANRAVLQKIVDGGQIFEAWADQEWTVDGAAVRVSLVCFSVRTESIVRLDDRPARQIFSDLKGRLFDVTKAVLLRENQKVSFVGVILNGEFEVPPEVAREWLNAPVNVNGRPNSDVLRPTFNGDDFNGHRDEKWVIDFGVSITEKDAALYELPFQWILQKVKPYRQRQRDDGSFAVRAKSEREIWWRHARARPAMRSALAPFRRFIASPMVSSYRTFDFLDAAYLPDQKLVVFARDDLTIFGIVHSRFHLDWTVATCSWIGSGNDVTYSNQAVFVTFPFPEGLTPNIPAKDYAGDPRAQAIAKAAKRLDELRNNWLNPPDLVRIEPEVVPGYPDRILPKDTVAAATLRERTLTKLYNQRPQWLLDAHRDLDAAVAAAYGWPADISEEDALAKLLELNLARAGTGSVASPAEAGDADDED